MFSRYQQACQSHANQKKGHSHWQLVLQWLNIKIAADNTEKVSIPALAKSAYTAKRQKAEK